MAVACLPGGCADPNELNALLKNLGAAMDLDRGFEITENRLIQDSGLTIRTIRAQAGTHIVRIQEVRGLPDNKARQMIIDQCYLIDCRFYKQQVPYPGLLSNIAECPAELRPVIEREDGQGWVRVYYHMFANQRLVCGGYDEETLVYTYDLLLAYCRGKHSFYKIEYFVPKQEEGSEGRRALRSFRCR